MGRTRIVHEHVDEKFDFGTVFTIFSWDLTAPLGSANISNVSSLKFVSYRSKTAKLYSARFDSWRNVD